MAGLFRGNNGQSDFGFAAIALGFALTLLALAGVVIEFESPVHEPSPANNTTDDHLPTRPSSTVASADPAVSPGVEVALNSEAMAFRPPLSNTKVTGSTPISSAPPKVEPTRGRVFLPGGNPASGAWVTLREEGDSYPIAEATADQKGSFVIPGDFGDLSLVLSVTHPRAHAVERAIPRHPGPEGLNLGNLELFPPRDLVLNLRDTEGHRLPGVTVRLSSKYNRPAQMIEERTDEDGDAVFVNLRDRTYGVTIESLKWPTHLTDLSLDSTDYEFPERHIYKLEQGMETLRGSVVTQEGQAVEGARVIAESLPDGMTILLEGLTQANGRFELSQAPRTFYQIRVEHPEFVQERSATKILSVEDDTTVTMVKSGGVRGVLQTDKPVPAVTHFRLWEVSASELIETPYSWSDAPKNTWTPFEYTSVAPGTYILEGRAPGYQPAATDPFEVKAGECFDQTWITLLRASIVTGRVVDAQGEASRGARVALEPEAPSEDRFQTLPLESSTDENGDYRIEGVPVGRYRMTVNAPGHSELRRSNLVIPAGEHRHLGTQTMSIGGLVRVSARLRDGRPVPRMRVMVQSVENGQEYFFETNSSGMAQSLPLSPGIYKVALAPFDATQEYPSKETVVKDSGITTVNLVWAGGRL